MSNHETPTVERFDLTVDLEGGVTGTKARGRMFASPEYGEWVRHADYLTLSTEHTRLREENERLQAALEWQAAVTKELLPYQERAVRAEQDLARLRAEKEQLERQAREISEALGDAGFGPCTLPEGVRKAIAHLRAERDEK